MTTDTHYTLAHALLWDPPPCRSSVFLASRARRSEGLVVPSLNAWKQLMKRVEIIIFLIPRFVLSCLISFSLLNNPASKASHGICWTFYKRGT